MLWKKDTSGLCARLDASADSTRAVLNYGSDSDTSPGAGTVVVFGADGQQVFTTD